MTQFVVNINDKTQRGKLLAKLISGLEAEKDVKVYSLREYEKMEDRIIANEINKGEKSEIVSFDDFKKKLTVFKRKAKR